jgi:hypothetical protein
MQVGLGETSAFHILLSLLSPQGMDKLGPDIPVHLATWVSALDTAAQGSTACFGATSGSRWLHLTGFWLTLWSLLPDPTQKGGL